MRILFMGTPEISATALSFLLESGLSVSAVVTREDKPRGRRNVMTPTKVKELAIQNEIPVYTPRTLRDEEFYSLLKGIDPELIVVVAYGKILPPEVINYPKYGCINLHVSLLPKYRGAAPMQRAIMEGEKETGVTIMYMDEGLDTGDIITSESFPIESDDDFEAIHDRSALVGSRLLVDTIRKIEEGTATRTPQDPSLATYAEKVEKEDAKIDFSLSARELDFRIRGVTPIPGAFAYLNEKMLKICRAEPISEKRGVPGEVTGIDGTKDGSFTVACGEGSLKISLVIPEGKGRMTAGDFIRGRKINLGDILK
jgi:methionyl-tRNA formyltransferase